jgi:HEAT repeat protein
VQHAVLETAAVIPSAPLAGALQRLLGSADGGMRVAAARVLGRVKYAPAAPELKRILEGKELRQTDVTEKVAFFEAYGTLAGEGAVEFLDRVLNGRGFLGRREPADVRAGAALGLGKVGTTAARAALERARDEEDPVVRSAVGRALKGEGGSDG